MNVFKEYAKYYDLLYQDKDYNAETDYIDSLIKKNNKNLKFILDLGCGTGKHSILLTEKGYDVFGVDLSEDMISLAQKQFGNRENLKFSCGDMRSLNLNKKFDVVLSLFHVMSYQTTNEDLLNSFFTANRHLKKSGLFIFDFWYGPAVLHNLPEKRDKKISNNEIELNRYANPTVDSTLNIVDVNYKINLRNKISGAVLDFEENHKMRYFFIPEILKFLEDTGFELINFEEWLTGKKPNFDSWGVCFICRKK